VSGSSRELRRKLLHVGMGGFAFMLRWLDWRGAALCALAALLSNLFLLPHIGGRKVFRGAAAEKGYDTGILLYPVSVLALILLFPHRLEIVAAAWAMLAFGDGLATIAGVTLGRFTGPLPWNRDKSWAGLAGFMAGGIPMAVILLEHVTGGTAGTVWTNWGGSPWIPAAVVGVIMAVVESLPLGINDNLVVPLGSGALFYVFTLADPRLFEGALGVAGSRLPWALGVNLAFALLAYGAKSVDLSGVVHGVLLGTALWVFGSGPAFVMLAMFFVIGTAATKVGHKTKAREGTAQEKGGRRGAKHAWANTGAAVIFGVLAAITPHAALFRLALVASLATATSDTLGSEIGQAFGRRAFLITTFRPVPRGTDGAVSLEGTLAGIAGSLVLALAALGLGLIGAAGVGWVVLAAFVGTTLESYLGALLERAKMIDNEAQNFLNTVAGGLAAAAFSGIFG
jgi:uncharacterized protein (TIGR00297 family)